MLALAKLEKGIAGILDADLYRDYLRMMGKFHDYSYNNVLLIALQKPDASHVAGYRRWQEMGRQVKKGERGLGILAPVHAVIEDEVTKERRQIVSGFRSVAVFDISQTEGKPLPVGPVAKEITTTTEGSAVLARYVTDYVQSLGATVATENKKQIPIGNGYYRPTDKHIGILDTLSADHQAKTLVHETAHCVAEHKGYAGRPDEEILAESVAYVVLQHFGLDSGAYSFGYVAGWAQDTRVLKRNLEHIQKVSTTIIQGIEKRPRPKP